MPNVDNNILESKPGKKSLKDPFTIYADLGCLLLKLITCNNNPFIHSADSIYELPLFKLIL